MKKLNGVTIILNKYDFKPGIMKNFYDNDLSLNDFKISMKEFEKAERVEFHGLGVNDVLLGGTTLKSRGEFIDRDKYKNSIEREIAIINVQSSKDRRKENIFILCGVLGTIAACLLVKAYF